MAFTNTVDSKGDAALTDSIIDRSVTEYCDNNVTEIGGFAFAGCNALKKVDCPSVTSISEYAFDSLTALASASFETATRVYGDVFRYCTALTNVNLPEVTSIDSGAFQGCTALKLVILPKVTNLNSQAFYGCTALKQVDLSTKVSISGYVFNGCTVLDTLILRSATLCTLSNKSALNSTAIANGTGYIYVPSALVDSYKTASNWSNYANQFRAIEDYPYINDPYTWEAVNAAMDDGVYASCYKVGDCVPLDLGSEGVINMQIAAFDTDNLADGSGKAKISWIAKELLKTSKRMNPSQSYADGAYVEGTGSVGGWEKCEMRTYLKDTIKPLISENVANRIATVTKTQQAYDTKTTSFIQTTEDDVWIPKSDEVYKAGGIYTTLFANNTSRVKCVVGKTDSNLWWLRNGENYSLSFGCVTTSGTCSYNSTDRSCGVCLGFCTN